jgi:hypothetical protein
MGVGAGALPGTTVKATSPATAMRETGAIVGSFIGQLHRATSNGLIASVDAAGSRPAIQKSTRAGKHEPRDWGGEQQASLRPEQARGRFAGDRRFAKQSSERATLAPRVRIDEARAYLAPSRRRSRGPGQHGESPTRPSPNCPASEERRRPKRSGAGREAGTRLRRPVRAERV